VVGLMYANIRFVKYACTLTGSTSSNSMKTCLILTKGWLAYAFEQHTHTHTHTYTHTHTNTHTHAHICTHMHTYRCGSSPSAIARSPPPAFTTALSTKPSHARAPFPPPATPPTLLCSSKFPLRKIRAFGLTGGWGCSRPLRTRRKDH